MDTEERWVDVDQVAAHVDVTNETLYRCIDKRGFPAHMAGRLLRFKLYEVDYVDVQQQRQGRYQER
ncbi:MAG: excisionase family DNA-binding protein [Candidatus Uhrbacteria bacterium]|nr:excisionase family DNA-binding protein [Candidatus Uhrbacteria bacterium]